MNFNRKQLLEWGQVFIDTCEKNDIWYAADAETLLGTQRHGGFVPWNEKLQVMMSVESYTKLLRLFPEHVIDGSIDPKYNSLKPSFVKDIKTWQAELPFVEIRIVVPTTVKKVKQFKSPLYRAKNLVTLRKDNTKIAINDLYETRYEGFYTITSRFSLASDNWFPKITFKTKKAKFNTLQINIPVEYKRILSTIYGDNYMKTELPPKYYDYPAPTKAIRRDV